MGIQAYLIYRCDGCGRTQEVLSRNPTALEPPIGWRTNHTTVICNECVEALNSLDDSPKTRTILVESLRRGPLATILQHHAQGES